MRQRMMSMFFVFLVFGLGFALAGCGGNGGGTDPEPMPPPMESEALQQLRTDLTGAKAALAMLAEDDYQGQVDQLMKIVGLKERIYEMSEAEADQEALGMARTQLAAAQMKLDEYNADKMKREDAARMAAMAKGLTAAITSTGARPGGSTLNADFQLNAGGEIVLDGDTLGEDDKFGAQEFRRASQAPTPIPGWKAATYSRTVQAEPTYQEKDDVTIYSNAEGAKSQSYMAYFTSTTARPNVVTNLADASAGAGQAAERYDAGATIDIGGVTYAEGTLLLAPASGTTLTEASRKALDSRFIKKPAASNTQTIDQTSAASPKEHSGTFNGLDGHYICAGTAACTVTFDDQGNVTAIGGTGTGTLTFRPSPASGRGRVPGVIRDMDYLAFGYWLQTVNNGGTLSYGINPFYSGADPYVWASGTPTDLGKATYNGDAAGAYSRRAITANGIGDPVDAGTFTADVSLTASFQGDNVAAADQYSIAGTVSNFMNEQGEKISDSWSLTLEKTHFGTGAGGTTVPADGTAWTFSGGSTAGGGKAGTWEGAFYGGNRTAAATGNARQPGSVAGSFDGNFLNGHVIGAFGATKQ